jgi:hypothetical protein
MTATRLGGVRATCGSPPQTATLGTKRPYLRAPMRVHVGTYSTLPPDHIGGLSKGSSHSTHSTRRAFLRSLEQKGPPPARCRRPCQARRISPTGESLGAVRVPAHAKTASPVQPKERNRTAVHSLRRGVCPRRSAMGRTASCFVGDAICCNAAYAGTDSGFGKACARNMLPRGRSTAQQTHTADPSI